MRLLDPAEVQVAAASAPEGSSTLVVDGLTAVVPGLVVEAAARLEADDPIRGYLLFLTDDAPFEDALSITLADADLRPLDRARLGGIYATGTWARPAIEGPGRLGFDFIDGKRWHLRVLARPALRLTLPGEPAGTRRPWRLFSHFHLSAG